MVAAHFTRSKATPKLRRGSRSRRVSLSPPLLALPARSRSRSRRAERSRQAAIAAAARRAVLSNEDSINDPPSPTPPRLPSPHRGRARANLSEVCRRLVDHAAALFPEPNPPGPAPEALANDVGGPLLLHWRKLAPILKTSLWMVMIAVMVMLLPLKPPLLLLLPADPSQAVTQFGWPLITHPSLPKA